MKQNSLIWLTWRGQFSVFLPHQPLLSGSFQLHELVSNRRSCLKPENVDRILFLNKNLPSLIDRPVFGIHGKCKNLCKSLNYNVTIHVFSTFYIIDLIMKFMHSRCIQFMYLSSATFSIVVESKHISMLVSTFDESSDVLDTPSKAKNQNSFTHYWLPDL